MVRFAFVLLLCLLLPLSALAEKRLALLIGNQSYTSEIGRLTNPHNDVALMESALKRLGFEVAAVHDAGLAGLHQAVNAYARRVRAAGANAVGFFYYGGHGAAEAGTNYLIPVDVTSAEEGELWDRSLRLTEITRKLKTEAGNATHFVVFDACRNNLKLKQAGSRALVQSRGFVPVTQESGILIAYATAEGELASDVGAGAGPYASALADEIVKPGVEAVTMFRNVQRRVRATIKQEPYLGFNALGDVYLAGPAPDLPKMEVAPATVPPSEAGRAWDVTKDTGSIPSLEAFIRRFGDTFYGDLARVRLAELKQANVAKQATEAAKRKAEEATRAKAEAERQRLALLQLEQEGERAKAAQKPSDVTQSGEETRTKDTQAVANPAKIAALPASEKATGSRQFDGAWTITIEPKGKCNSYVTGRARVFSITIADAAISGGTASGSVSHSGAVQWMESSPQDRSRQFSGTLHGDSGSGKFEGVFCAGTFTAKRK